MPETFKNILPADVQSELMALELNRPEFNYAFQNCSFFNFFAAQKDADAYCFLKRDDDMLIIGYVMAVVLKSTIGGKFGRRCVVWNQMMLFTETGNVAAELLQTLKTLLARKVFFIEFRNFQTNRNLNPVFEAQAFNFRNHIGLRIEHEDVLTAHRELSESKRRQIRKSMAAGVSIERAATENDVQDFYAILKELYKTKVKKPLPSLHFFTSFLKHGPGLILLVKKEQKVIGGVLLVTEKGKGVYEWYVAGSDVAYKKLYPSVMATWAAIEYTFENEYSFFDFMGGGKPGQAYGVRDFKMTFGAQKENTGRWLFTNYKSILNFVNRFTSYTI